MRFLLGLHHQESKNAECCRRSRKESPRERWACCHKSDNGMRKNQFRIVLFVVVFLVTVVVHHAVIGHLIAELPGLLDVPDGWPSPRAAAWEKTMKTLLLGLDTLLSDRTFMVGSILAACLWGVAFGGLATLVHAIATRKGTP